MTNQNGSNANHPIVSPNEACQLAPYWQQVREKLGFLLEETAQSKLTDALHRLVQILEIVRIEEQIPLPRRGGRGREEINRRPIARAFLAKAVLNLPTTLVFSPRKTTRQLIEQLHQSSLLRSLCGMETVPSEPTFSRAFAVFAEGNLEQSVHQSLVTKFVTDQVVMHQVVMHISHDATAVEAREKALKKVKQSKDANKQTREKKMW